MTPLRLNIMYGVAAGWHVVFLLLFLDEQGERLLLVFSFNWLDVFYHSSDYAHNHMAYGVNGGTF